ncbi:nuclear RNA binding protein B [Theileria orientalis strain Shintoku]|uniref:Nuclear RNA binding protein B n=1 Tax=Theileria orientalis strain Shintoku TaxID=869250 RepID=J4C962_THEOR|nr:nuclear RNA binding protein B [Theileria orientalis strain Shintoku]PVC52525.1 nuclear RNA binding protein B [Theileria orientalis]BAM41983.1 nuclear RNA binding protein B [Theileria orientalis strain Shintoku]|eukprot:XP_009692284.1 nuclear RNA binding protein B [Theileria orientalis strain Shintoku]
MAANKVTYNVGTSNQFAGFYDDHEVVYYHPDVIPRTHVPYGNAAIAYHVVPAYVAVDNVPTYTDDNIIDTRARARHTSRRFRGNPNAARKFDRLSGTGRGKEIKKQGEGGHNWGNPSKESKTPNAMITEDNELAEELNNLTLNDKTPSKSNEEKELNRENGKDKGNDKTKNDIMDFESYKLLQKSKRTNLPTFTVNDKKTVSTDEELQNGGYVKYVKKTEETKTQEKVKVVNYNVGSNPSNVLPSHPSSFRDRKSRKNYSGQPRPRNTNNRIRVKAPDFNDLKMFPCLELTS